MTTVFSLCFYDYSAFYMDEKKQNTKTLMAHEYNSLADPCLVDLPKKEDNKGHRVCSPQV